MIPHVVQTACLNAALELAIGLAGRRQQSSSDRKNADLGKHINDRLRLFFSFAESHIPTSTTLPYSVVPVLKVLWRIQAMIQSVTTRPLDISPVYQREELPIRLEQISHAVDQLYELTPSLINLHKLETVVDNRDGPAVKLDTFEITRTTGRLAMTLKEQANTYKTIITRHPSQTGSSYEEQVAAELSRRLGECIPGQNTRLSATGTREVAPSFSEALRLYAAEYKESRSSEKLNHIHILGEAQGSPARDLERAILQCGKRLRLLNAPVAQCHLNFLHISPNPFDIGHIEEMLDHLKKDKAVAGRVADTYGNIVFSGLSDASLAATQVQEEEAPHSKFSLLEPTPKDCEINIRGLSNYTEIETLRLQFSSFGTIIRMEFDEDTDEFLTGAAYDFYASQRNATELGNERPPPSSRSGSRQRITRIIYARDDEAEAACDNMNGSRFDGELIHVFMVKREPGRQALSPVPEGDGLHARPRY
ncbi:hypothetical protein BO85DRAFT_501221 [Aspergillus piperis CBS 112811]|uniref:RRM domain-containing protein n=1 Tax=Aspergillus piperis CBS 112811 TaxID=1448313 RepID=A0A8G1RAX2_9EURO|nr:hypothetical protein BO85DRAFT_501221 [Aspergillus piperis CBS 112811]RAH61707.1 hypothetical protein BO85DRAFT_501221 [Aspergillus piperis CBS 112811]